MRDSVRCLTHGLHAVSGRLQCSLSATRPHDLSSGGNDLTLVGQDKVLAVLLVVVQALHHTQYKRQRGSVAYKGKGEVESTLQQRGTRVSVTLTACFISFCSDSTIIFCTAMSQSSTLPRAYNHINRKLQRIVQPVKL